MSEDVQKIPAVNPTPEQMAELKEAIANNSEFDVNVQETAFHFKKQTDKETGVESKRESLKLAIPYPSVDGVVKILEAGGKQLELLMDAIQSVIVTQTRDLINEDSKMELNATNFPVEKLSWKYISEIPKATRRGGGIPKEVWDAFAEDYIEVMPAATGKTLDQINNMVKILINKLSSVKTNEPVLNMVKEQLAVYANATANLEDYAECVEFLDNKADTFLNVSPEDLLAAL